MHKLCKQYISDVKLFFPIMGKEEKKYLAKLKYTVEDFCEEENITTMNKLYDEIGLPSDIANSYYTCTNTQKLLKQIQYMRYNIAVLLIAIIIFSANIYLTYKIFFKRKLILKMRQRNK